MEIPKLEPAIDITARVEHLETPHGLVLADDDSPKTIFESQRLRTGARTSIVYPSARELVEPFLEQLNPLRDLGIDLRVQTSHPTTVQDPETEVDHTAYGRFLVEARIGPVVLNHRRTIGFVVALDRGKPSVQVYAGYNAEACINLAIFRKDRHVSAELLKGGDDVIYRMTKVFVVEFSADEQHFLKVVGQLQANTWSETEVNEKIGRLYRSFLTKGNLTSTLNYAIKLMSNESGPYAFDEKGGINAWKFFSAMTQYITDKAYPDQRASKTLEVVEAVCPEYFVVEN